MTRSFFFWFAIVVTTLFLWVGVLRLLEVYVADPIARRIHIARGRRAAAQERAALEAAERRALEARRDQALRLISASAGLSHRNGALQ